jgi:phenylacetic acid degradation operon negative regulatory protein
MNTPSPSEALKLLLNRQDRLRLWSVIVTIIGEVAQTIGGEITINEMIDICGLMDIEPQAVRTAMSRLTREGWVDQRPEDESILYRFSNKGLSGFNAANPVVFGYPKESDLDWCVGILPVLEEEKKALIEDLAVANPIIMNNQIALWQRKREKQISDQTLFAMTRFDTLPLEWPDSLWEDVVPSPQLKLINQLIAIVENASKTKLVAEDALVIRVLLNHFWRRLVLWHPPIVAPFDEELWPMPKLQRILAETYHDLVEKSLPALPRPPDMAVIESRFRA